MQTVLLVNEDTVFWKSLTAFSNPLVETRSDDVKESLKFCAVFYFLDKLGNLLKGELDGLG